MPKLTRKSKNVLGLCTQEEQRLLALEQSHTPKKLNIQLIYEQDQYDVQDIQKVNTGKLSDVLVNLISKNKINYRNAFEVPVIPISKDTSCQEAWKQISSNLEASSKIYSFRVDNVLGNTFKMAQQLNRNQKQTGRQPVQRQVKLHQLGQLKSPTLQKNISSITMSRFDLQFAVDPLFKSHQIKFDSSRSMLFDSVPFTSNLQYSLTCSQYNLHPPTATKYRIQDQQIQEWNCGWEIGDETQQGKLVEALMMGALLIDKALKMGTQIDMQMQFEQVAAQLRQNKNSKDPVQRSGHIPIQKKIKKTKPVPAKRGLLDDARHWMDRQEMQMLNLDLQHKHEASFNFEGERVSINDLFLKRGQWREEGNQRSESLFLLPSQLREGPEFLHNFFLLNQALDKVDFLENGAFIDPEAGLEIQQETLKFQARRLHMSIKELKDRMKNLLKPLTYFSEIWDRRSSAGVNFVALLHLANQLKLGLQQKQGDLRIYKQ